MEKRIFKKILITGITGSGGSYLADYILAHHPSTEVHGLARWHSTSSRTNLEHIKDRVTVHESDLTDLSSIVCVLKEVEPDGIFHLASYANVRAAFYTPLSVLNNNVMGTANLYEAVRICEIDPFIQLCSTSEVYGKVSPDKVPINEDCPLNPVNPYAVSKAAQDLLGFSYFKSYQLKIIRTRMFAYLNPRRADLFATSFARQVARIENGLQSELLHGNLDSTRTIIDIRDAMESYWVALEKGAPGEVYNIGGDTVITVGEFLDLLKQRAKVEIPSRLDPELLRPTDVTLQIPDVSKFKKETGWKPRYSFRESVEHLLDFCRDQVRREELARNV